MATRNPDLAIAGEIRNLNFDQVRARVAAADPHTFYRKAAAFEQAAERLELFADLLRRYRAELESAWNNGDPRQFEWVDRLLRHVDELTSSLREPSYPAALRHIGDAVANSQQRLRGLENHSGTVPDEGALLARDEHARQILTDLSTSYVQFGQPLAELPERSVTGVPIQVPATPVEGAAAHRLMAPAMAPLGTGHGAGAGTATTNGSRSAVSAPASPVDGGVPRSAAAEPFGRLSHFATAQPAPVKADQTAKFGGFASMALPAEGVVPLLASPASAAGDNARKDSTGKAEKPAQRREGALPANLPASPLAGATAAQPATVSAEPATAASRTAGGAHTVTVAGQSVTVTGQPATVVAAAAAPATASAASHATVAVPAVASGAPAALQSTGVSPVITAAATPAPAAAPPAHPTLASRPPLPGEFPAMSTSVGGSAAPLGDAHTGMNSSAAAASTGAVPPPAAVGAGSMAGAPVSRVDSTWLRADPGTWSASNAQGTAARPGHGTGGGGCAPAGVIGHSENGKGEAR
ncbi:hypothetical protein UK23_47720 [Lentzea aerocolonigenes]|uniref:Uncharacterized protein n=1 Tax=Lentzea aerocolonigenes TaxID=68170 RepID=A0A0F0GCX7_LENAE|nr:hypothetical protein [Lentzea aerocolonigenes]KJK33059.1 hypothetical protein UK23_47720 [Lentzea aerocolonigenes]